MRLALFFSAFLESIWGPYNFSKTFICLVQRSLSQRRATKNAHFGMSRGLRALSRTQTNDVVTTELSVLSFGSSFCYNGAKWRFLCSIQQFVSIVARFLF